ncbi:transposase [Kineococcus terrestris]|uniref:transposase n=1 Tax=Kineococcus terrestris TaxID=2044856 RepID=UPI0034DAED46
MAAFDVGQVELPTPELKKVGYPGFSWLLTCEGYDPRCKTSTVPKPSPATFHRHVIAVARQSGLSHAEVARSFEIVESCLGRWMATANREDGPVEQPPAAGTDLQAENRELRRRNKQLE